MSMEYIRTRYGVPAKRGGRIRFVNCGIIREGTIRSGNNNGHLVVRFDGQKRNSYLHPTWNVTYL